VAPLVALPVLVDIPASAALLVSAALPVYQRVYQLVLLGDARSRTRMNSMSTPASTGVDGQSSLSMESNRFCLFGTSKHLHFHDFWGLDHHSSRKVQQVALPSFSVYLSNMGPRSLLAVVDYLNQV